MPNSDDFDPKKFERSIIEKVKMVFHRHSDDIETLHKRIDELQSRVMTLERHSAIYSMTQRIEKLEQVIIDTEG